MARPGRAVSLQAETEVLGVNHAELGGRIAGQWKLPERLMNGVTFHHTPDAGGDVVCDVVYLANVAAKRIGEGVVRGPAEVVASEGSPPAADRAASEDLLPAARRLEATLAQCTKD